MKSAFELAMERLGGDLHEYTEEQKEQLAEVDRIFDAKMAQAKFDAQSRRSAAGEDGEKLEQIQDDVAVELRSVEEQREKKKEALRAQFKKQNDVR